MARLSIVAPNTRLQDLRQALRELSEERFTTFEALIALAEEAHSSDEPGLAMGAAGLVLVGEHLRAARYDHSLRARALLALGATPVHPRTLEEFMACAGAVLCEAYGSWPPLNAATLRVCIGHWISQVEDVLALQLPADAVLLWACALGEWCERNGEAASFERIAVIAEAADADTSATSWMRAHWRVVRAWHLQGFGHTKPANLELEAAERLAHDAGLPALESMVWLQQARLTLWRFDGERAREMAARAAARGDARRTPIWLADQADVECRVALLAGNFTQALASARRAKALLRLSGALPTYDVTYCVNEAYALIGLGSFDRAIVRLSELATQPLPSYLAERLAVVQSLAQLAGDDGLASWNDESDRMLAATMRRLRELEWPTVFTLLPRQIARLFARALDAGVENAWVVNAIVLRGLPPPPLAGPAWPWRIRIRVLGPFECEVDGQSLAAESGKAAAKPLSLLRRLAVLAGYDGIPAESVAKQLWPGEGREGREKVLETTLARLRKVLGGADSVLLHEHRLRLNSGLVWIDAAMLAGELDSLRGPEVTDTQWHRIVGLYRGPLLADETADWIIPWRNRLRALLATALLTARGTPGDRERWMRACAVDAALASHRTE